MFSILLVVNEVHYAAQNFTILGGRRPAGNGSKFFLRPNYSVYILAALYYFVAHQSAFVFKTIIVQKIEHFSKLHMVCER